MATGKHLTGPEKVRQLRTVLHAKAKEEPGRRFHALIDKVWREDFLAEAYRRVRRNRGSFGVDGEDFADIESYGPAHRHAVERRGSVVSRPRDQRPCAEDRGLLLAGRSGAPDRSAGDLARPSTQGAKTWFYSGSSRPDGGTLPSG